MISMVCLDSWEVLSKGVDFSKRQVQQDYSDLPVVWVEAMAAVAVAVMAVAVEIVEDGHLTGTSP